MLYNLSKHCIVFHLNYVNISIEILENNNGLGLHPNYFERLISVASYEIFMFSSKTSFLNNSNFMRFFSLYVMLFFTLNIVGNIYECF